jgi:hypothetical protein
MSKRGTRLIQDNGGLKDSRLSLCVGVYSPYTSNEVAEATWAIREPSAGSKSLPGVKSGS